MSNDDKTTICIGYPKIEAYNDLKEVYELIGEKLKKWKKVIEHEGRR